MIQLIFTFAVYVMVMVHFIGSTIFRDSLANFKIASKISTVCHRNLFIVLYIIAFYDHNH